MYLWQYYRNQQYMTDTGAQPFLYRFLIDSKFRIWRHILLILVLTIIAFNQTFLLFSEDIDILGNYIFLMCLLTLALYMAVAYSNIYILEPRFLLKKKYILYAILLFSSVVLILLLRSALEYFACRLLGLPPRMSSYDNPILIISSLAFCTITSICIFGTSVSVLLKHFMNESQHVSQLEREHIQSEVDQLKEQIAPDFLSNILNHTSVLVKTDAAKASEMLMKLGQLLRYQLYDCNRGKVLLNSAVSFITNYLILEQLYSNKINYQITTTGNINRILIPPLLLIPFVRHATNISNSQPSDIEIRLHFDVDDDNDESVLFTCSLSDSKIALDGDDFSSVKQRLDLLYADNYSLTIKKDIIELQLKSLEL